MNFFRKKLIVEYMDILDKNDAKDIFKIIPNNYPKYFFSIPKEQFHPEKKKFFPYARTIKTCPGFINLYKRSLLITSPFDIYIELDEDRIIESEAGQTQFNVAKLHSNEQFLDYTPNNKYKFIMKINLPFYINTNVSLHISPSIYHFNNFNILPGIIPNNYEGQMNFFIPIKKERDELHIKKGDPLFLMTPLCEKTIQLKFEKLKQNKKNFLEFSSLKKFSLKNLIQ